MVDMLISRLRLLSFRQSNYLFALMFNGWFLLEFVRLRSFAHWEDTFSFFLSNIVFGIFFYFVGLVASVTLDHAIIRIILVQVPPVLVFLAGSR